MADVEIYVKTGCPYCIRAVQLIEAKGVGYKLHNVDFGGEKKQQMVQRANGRMTVPQIFIAGEHVGGCDDLMSSKARASSTRCWPPDHGPDRHLPVVDGHRSGGQRARTGRGDRARRRRAARKCCSRRRCRACSIAIPNAAAANMRGEDDDDVLAACREAASRHGIWLHLGSLAVRNDGRQARQPRLRDRSDGARSVRATTRSICSTSTCRLAKAGGNRRSIGRATSAVVVDGTPVGRLGLTICYDLRFPELFSRLAEAGARPIAVPAAFTVPTGPRIGKSCSGREPSRRRLFVVAAAQSAAMRTAARPMAIRWSSSPWGEVLLDMGQDTGVGFRGYRAVAGRRGAAADSGAASIAGRSPRRWCR